MSAVGSGRAHWVKALIGAVLAAALIGVVEYWLGWSRLLRPWAALAPTTLAAALALALLSQALRALRFQRFFHAARGIAFRHALQLVLRHNLFNNLLPMRSGEISFPLLAQRAYGIDTGTAVGGLLVFRALDLHTIFWLGALALAAATGSAVWLIAAAAIVPLPLAGPIVARYGRALPWRLPGKPGQWLARCMAAVPHRYPPLLEAWGWTVLAWVGKLAAFAWLLTRFGDVTFSQGWIGAIAGDLTSVLPIHGWAGAGTYEAGVVAALTPMGIDAAAALAMAVNLHLFILGTTLIGGLAAMTLPARRHSQTKPPEETD